MVQWVLSVFNGNNVKGAEKLKKKSSFSGQIGFVLAAAGSAVGVGNLWRFPYLVARDGGGLFLIIYLVLVLISICIRFFATIPSLHDLLGEYS